MADESQIGSFIAELRKAKGLTQKQLADRLGVTDKAISKWERGMGYPDITLLTKLAACLGVTASELLNGARDLGSTPAADQIVETTVQYAEKVSKRRHISLTRIFFLILTLLCVYAAAVCMICDFAINGAFTWAVFPVSAVLFGYLVLSPALYFRSSRFTLSLISLSIFILPFLLVMAHSTGGGWFFPVAVPCALAGLSWLWLVRLAFAFTQRSILRTMGCALLLMPVVDFTVSFAVGRYTASAVVTFWDVLGYVLCFIFGVLLLLRCRMPAKQAEPV